MRSRGRYLSGAEFRMEEASTKEAQKQRRHPFSLKRSIRIFKASCRFCGMHKKKEYAVHEPEREEIFLSFAVERDGKRVSTNHSIMLMRNNSV